MTTREKRLAGLCLLALLYALGDFVYGRLFSPQKAADPAEARTREVNAAVQGLGTSLAGMPLGKAGRSILEEAARPLARSVFLPERPAAVDPAAAAKRLQGPDTLTYTGYIDVAGRVLAVISGMEYAAGDTIPATGDVVRRISAGSVTLFSPSRQTEWELSYSGDEF